MLKYRYIMSRDVLRHQLDLMEIADNGADDSIPNDLSEPPPVATSVATEVESINTPTLSSIQNKDKFQMVCETLLEKRRDFGIWDIKPGKTLTTKSIIENISFGDGPIRFIQNEKGILVAYHGVHPHASTREHNQCNRSIEIKKSGIEKIPWTKGRFVTKPNPQKSYKNVYETVPDTFDTFFCTNCEIIKPTTSPAQWTTYRCKGHHLKQK